ncbi:PPK2 family polyphosphate kinase [Lysinimonas soli]|uniref:PPK2 family polyphosphate kinase n=1 Tax=Lysinimonas soli TaxID=1074233 RepID=A0ABW0NQ81_9MICO
MDELRDIEGLLRAGDGFVLAAVDPASTPGFRGGKKRGVAALAAGAVELAELQEKLYASGLSGDGRRVLLVLQAMDTAGKGGIVGHVVGSVNPYGVHIVAFKAPTAEEREHDFLWRIRRQLPTAGMLGVFDRSHYEDVLVQRVRQLSSPDVIEERYDLIVDFERELVAAGTTVIKVMLHISPEEQRARLEARLDDPSKHWKFNPGDLDDRALWPDFMTAYQLAIQRTATAAAPWYVVPADRKWYARVAVQQLLIEALRGFGQAWPAADYDVARQRARLAAE